MNGIRHCKNGKEKQQTEKNFPPPPKKKRSEQFEKNEIEVYRLRGDIDGGYMTKKEGGREVANIGDCTDAATKGLGEKVNWRKETKNKN